MVVKHDAWCSLSLRGRCYRVRDGQAREVEERHADGDEVWWSPVTAAVAREVRAAVAAVLPARGP